MKENEKKKTILKNKTKNKLPEKTIKKIFLNIFFAIVLMVYFLIINIGYVGLTDENLEKVIELFSGIFLVVGLSKIEKAYKQDNDSKAITAIELLVISMYTLSITHIIKKYKFDFQIYITATSYVCAIYFVFKSIIIYTQSKRKILENASDIKEIVKKEKPVKKEATKKTDREDNEKEISIKIPKTEKMKNAKKASSTAGNGTKTTTRKRTTTSGKAKIENKETSTNEIAKKTTTRKRTTTSGTATKTANKKASTNGTAKKTTTRKRTTTSGIATKTSNKTSSNKTSSNKRTAVSGKTRTTATKKTRTAKTAEGEPSTIKKSSTRKSKEEVLN